MNESVQKLDQICGEIVDVEMGLMDGTISFAYDNLKMAMGAMHPAEEIEEILGGIYFDVVGGKEPPLKKVKETLSALKDLKKACKIKELNSPIKKLTEYIKEKEEPAV